MAPMNDMKGMRRQRDTAKPISPPPPLGTCHVSAGSRDQSHTRDQGDVTSQLGHVTSQLGVLIVELPQKKSAMSRNMQPVWWECTPRTQSNCQGKKTGKSQYSNKEINRFSPNQDHHPPHRWKIKVILRSLGGVIVRNVNMINGRVSIKQPHLHTNFARIQ